MSATRQSPDNALMKPVLRSAVAGVVGTLAMDAVWYARYRRGGGDAPFSEWEFTRNLQSWDDAPAPGKMGRKLIETLTRRPMGVEHAAAISNLVHWSYGVVWTVAYGTLGSRPLWSGPLFGAAVWASDYVTLPLAGIYKPIWEYDARTLYEDLSAHMVFGTATVAALRVMPPGRSSPGRRAGGRAA